MSHTSQILSIQFRNGRSIFHALGDKENRNLRTKLGGKGKGADIVRKLE